MANNKYWDTSEHKLCEIQRFSEELQPFSERIIYQATLDIPEVPKPWHAVESNNEILPLKLSNIIPLNANEFIVSGYSNEEDIEQANGIYKYDIAANKWTLFIPYPQKFFSQFHSMSYDYDKKIIFIITGLGGIGMWKIDITTKKFESFKLPNENQYGAQCLVLNSQCHLFWGHKNNTHAVWSGKAGYTVKEFENMDLGVVSHGMVYNEKDDYALLMGGFMGKGKGRTDKIWKYDAFGREWELLDVKLPDKMQSFGCLITEDCENLIVLGGCDEDGLNEKIYILNLKTMKWKLSGVVSPFSGIGFGNFVMIKRNNEEYIHLLNGVYNSIEVKLSIVLGL